MRLNRSAPKWQTIAFGALTGGVYGIEFLTDGLTVRNFILLSLNVVGYALIPMFKLGAE